MQSNQTDKVFMSWARHERYGTDTAIKREAMVRAFQMGKQLRKMLPECETIYCSPIDRAKQTAEFQALGMRCTHLLENAFLAEDTPTFSVRKFISQVILNTAADVRYYHFVTHLPVLEKLGLPIWAAGSVCLLSAASWTDMLAENFTVQTFDPPKLRSDFYQNFAADHDKFEKMSAEEIYAVCQAQINSLSVCD